MAGFSLPDEDLEYLNANFSSRWEQVSEGGKQGIVISCYELPKGIYTPEKSDLMLIIPSDYPVGMIDMFYFSPSIKRNDERTINALNAETHFGRGWQRWSRHYRWKPETHSIISHISYVGNQLKHDE